MSSTRASMRARRSAAGRFRPKKAAACSGSRVASWQLATRDPEHAAAFFGLNRPAADLRARIDARVEDMFRRGLVAETEALLKRGLAENRTASQALGYRQVMEHLRGERGLPETVELVKVRTRQFARRQMTWFRRQGRLTWIELEAGDSPAVVVDRLALELVHTSARAQAWR